MSYDRKRITGFIAAIGLAGVAATASAQETEELFGWDADGDQRMNQEEFEGVVEQGPWSAETPRGFEDPDGGGVDNLYNFSRYDANQDTFLDQEEMSVFGQEAGLTENEGWDWTPWDSDQDAMLSEPEYYAGIETVEAPYEGADGVSQDNLYDFSRYDANQDAFLDEEEAGVFADEVGGADSMFDWGAWDTDQDSRLSEAEYESGLETVEAPYEGGDGVSQDNLYDFSRYDADASGDLDDTEFTAFNEERSTGLFGEVDANADNMIGEQEYQDYFYAGNWHIQGGDGTNMPVEIPQFEQFDDDSDGFLDREEAAVLSRTWYRY